MYQNCRARAGLSRNRIAHRRCVGTSRDSRTTEPGGCARQPTRLQIHSHPPIARQQCPTLLTRCWQPSTVS